MTVKEMTELNPFNTSEEFKKEIENLFKVPAISITMRLERLQMEKSNQVKPLNKQERDESTERLIELIMKQRKVSRRETIAIVNNPL